MNLSRLDVGAIATYIAGGGLAGVSVFLGTLYPTHAAMFNSAAIALIAVAGLVRVVVNPQPTHTATVYNRDTGTEVQIKTVAPPSAVPAPPPTYTAPKGP